MAVRSPTFSRRTGKRWWVQQASKSIFASRSIRSMFFRQVMPWQTPMPALVRTLMSRTLRAPAAMARLMSPTVTSSQRQT